MRVEHARNMLETAALASRREGDLAETVAVTVIHLGYSWDPALGRLTREDGRRLRLA